MERFTSLAERLNHLLTLADRLPSGTSEDHVRRCVCDMIEADLSEQRHKVLVLLGSIVHLQHEREHGLRRAQRAGALSVERLLNALCESVVPLLQPFPNAVVDTAVAFDEESWDRWKERGRAADAATNQRLRIVVAGMAIAGLSAAAWMMA